ncbi:trinucleotide repeat-containing gene 6A protein-like [Esox lucius]|uniref:trinucleotide repeat-containing gene 6A protein-like n=1 Tax=Esox lucius TaxID=8010 RepID=UPI0014769593|nr:trinucleotide repeat-containing gene 6A protein-like [Esox lucius]
MAPIRDSVSHSPNQTGLDHPGLDSQYESSPWSSGAPCSSDSNSNWGKVLVDSVCSDKPSPLASSSTWPSSSSNSAAGSSSSTGSDPELTSECMEADSSSGSEKNLPSAVMAAAPGTSSVPGANVNGDNNGNRQPGGSQSNGNAPLGKGGSSNVTTCNRAMKGPWGGVAHSSAPQRRHPVRWKPRTKLGPWTSTNGGGGDPWHFAPKRQPQLLVSPPGVRGR